MPRLLFVDDEVQNLEIFRRGLIDRYEIQLARSGSEALELLETQEFDAIVTDYRMPEMNGAELLARAVDIRPDAARIVLSAYVDGESLRSAINLGRVHRVLDKPISLEDLASAIDRELEVQALRRDNARLALEVRARQEEESLARAEKLAAVGVMAAEIAHEIGSPLGYAMGNIDYLASVLRKGDQAFREAFGEGGHEVQEILAATLDGLKRIRELSRQLLNMASRGERPPAGPTDVVQAARTAARIVESRTKGLATVIVDNTPVPPARCNEGELVQVVANLVVNAAQACARIGDAHENLVHVTFAEQPAFVRILVSDNGPGFAPELVERAFLPFTTTRASEGGTGLGLSICKRLVEAYGGHIRLVAPEEGERGGTPGGRVEVLLPKVT